MVIKVYISSTSGNLQVKINQQRVLFILSANHIDHIVIDLADPINQKEKELMFSLAIANDKGLILAPQIFNEETYCGDMTSFEEAIESRELNHFLKINSN